MGVRVSSCRRVKGSAAALDGFCAETGVCMYNGIFITAPSFFMDEGTLVFTVGPIYILNDNQAKKCDT
jgi:hypothetical protein